MLVVVGREGDQAVNVARWEDVVVFSESHAGLHRVINLALVQLPLG